jgi:hypothetical protein
MGITSSSLHEVDILTDRWRPPETPYQYFEHPVQALNNGLARVPDNTINLLVYVSACVSILVKQSSLILLHLWISVIPTRHLQVVASGGCQSVSVCPMFTYKLPKYLLIILSGFSSVAGVTYGVGEGRSKIEAENEAATEALNHPQIRAMIEMWSKRRY